MQPANKRKLNCCKRNEKKRQRTDQHECHFCECTFRKKADLDKHVNYVHKCSTCHDIALTDDVRAFHSIRHKQEAQLKKLQEQHQRQMDDDFVLCYVKANKLDEYQASCDLEPDFDYIFSNYRFEREELLRLVNKFNDEFIVSFYNHSEEFQWHFESDDLIYLVENGALSTEDLIYVLDGFKSEHDVSMIEYLLDKDYEIKPEWVAKLIDNDELMKLIKEKHTFTFDEIYEVHKSCPDFYSPYLPDDEDTFYAQLHRHFPDPNFEDSSDTDTDEYEDFKCVTTEHVDDRLFSRYFYDRENDELSIVVGHGENEREISLGRCAEMSKKSLEVLVKEYKEEVKIYDELNDEVSDLFQKRDKELDVAEYSDKQSKRDGILEDYYYAIYRGALPERNNQANIVSKLYFVISMK